MSVLFAVNGALFANWVPRIPDVTRALELSESVLGLTLASAMVGALTAGALAGVAITRIGSGRLAVLCACAYGLLLFLLGAAPTAPALAAALLVLGAADAVMDVAMNAHGLRVQQAYGRSVLNGFHGWWSVGAVIGSLTGSAAAAAAVPVAVHLAVAGVGLALVAVTVVPWLLPEREAAMKAGSGPPVSDRGGLVRALGLLPLVAVLTAVVEDVPASWSALYLRQELGTGPGFAGLGYVAFAAAMTVGRLVGDRLVDRFGIVVVARTGTGAAAVTMTAALLTRSPLAAILGFAAVGAGIAPLFPAFFVAAAHRPEVRAASALTLVSWAARIGFLLAAPIVGVVAQIVGLAWGIGLVVLAAATLALLAGALHPRISPVASAP